MTHPGKESLMTKVAYLIGEMREGDLLQQWDRVGATKCQILDVVAELESLRGIATGMLDSCEKQLAEQTRRVAELEVQVTDLRAKLAELQQPQPAPPTSIDEIAAERARQRAKWGDGHDDRHADGGLVCAARLLLDAVLGEFTDYRWHLAEKHRAPRDRLRIAAALIAAEMDRMSRLDAVEPAPKPTEQPNQQTSAKGGASQMTEKFEETPLSLIDQLLLLKNGKPAETQQTIDMAIALLDADETNLLEAAAPLIRWMNNRHPHHTCIVTSTGVELLEGKMVFNTIAYLKD